MSTAPFKAMLHAAMLAAAMALAPVLAHAGRTCETRVASPAAFQHGLALAERTAKALDASGAQVVVLARAGQDLSRYGLSWSHLGLAYRDPASGHWRVIHKLNHCGSAVADVYRQGLGEFFLDDPWRYEAAYAVLKPALQQRVLDALVDDGRATRLHHAAYSMVAYPWAGRYQQRNQWAIETLASAIDGGAADRPRAQAWLQLRSYRPTTLQVGPMERLGARLTANHIAFDDHPPAQRFAGRIESVTADSVFDWLQRSGLGSAPKVVR